MFLVMSSVSEFQAAELAESYVNGGDMNVSVVTRLLRA